jgi:lantibiotic biosynthesis protein
MVSAVPTEPATRADLSGGASGRALFLSWLTATGWGDYAHQAGELLCQAFETAASERKAPSSLYSGMAGIGWVMDQHSWLTGIVLPGDPCASIDEALADLLDTWTWSGDYDLISGLIGIGIYGLARRAASASTALVERVVDLLDEGAETVSPGLAWRTPPGELPPSQAAEAPDGLYILGVAHGVPAAISFLAQAVAAGIAAPRARPLVEGAVDWLLAQRLAEPGTSMFPSFVGAGVQPAPARSAWCYGDPGMAATLMVAADCLDRAEWRDAAIAMATRAARRSRSDCGVVDAGLCHGAAGLAQIYNRLYHASGLKLFANAARSWLAATLEMMEPPASAHNIEARAGFLQGDSGVGLVRLAVLTNRDPSWDAALAISPAS